MLNEPLSLPQPPLNAVSYDNAGCFPFIVGVGLVVIVIAFLSEATVTWLFVLIGITALFARIALPSWQQRRQFAQQSVVTQGAITRLWQETTEDGEGGKSTHYYFAYTFPDGKETRQSITAQQCLFAQPGDVVTVRYFPDQPHLSQVDWQLTLSEKLREIENAQQL